MIVCSRCRSYVGEMYPIVCWALSYVSDNLLDCSNLYEDYIQQYWDIAKLLYKHFLMKIEHLSLYILVY